MNENIDEPSDHKCYHEAKANNVSHKDKEGNRGLNHRFGWKISVIDDKVKKPR